MINEEKIYQAYYTKSTPIVDYMITQLALTKEDSIFEPCGGDGVFIDAILDSNEFAQIDICELNPSSFAKLQKKYNHLPNVQVKRCDTLLDEDLIFNSNFGGRYDKVIANPPYGAWQDYDKRDRLKKLFPDLYAKETYGLFLYRCIELLKDGGRLSFIIPDTFLNLHMHKGLRKHLLTRTRISELALFPSSFFPGVSFGYANLCIITLEKTPDLNKCLSNTFKVINGFKSVEQLGRTNDNALKIKLYTQHEVLRNPDYAFLISDDGEISKLISAPETRVGDIASCVTGFYSGNDKKFLKVLNGQAKNAKNYSTALPKAINENYTEQKSLLDGIDSEKCLIPIVKGGNVKYVKPDIWYMDWSIDSVKHYKSDKKARFQNPQFYFKFGIGVPMISSSSITASLIDYKLFDQSIVGVFPKDERLTLYLLAFFNSPTCNKLIRTINPSANNPANYIKKIPFIQPDYKTLTLITELTNQIISSIRNTGSFNADTEEKIHTIMNQIYGF